MELDTFTQSYIECALWASTGDDDVPLDQDYSIDDFDPDELVAIAEDCNRFQTTYKALLDEAYQVPGYTEASAGHDYWLTRAHHGCGFWDRGLGEVGDKLTEAAHLEGESYLFVSDMGLIYTD